MEYKLTMYFRSRYDETEDKDIEHLISKLEEMAASLVREINARDKWVSRHFTALDFQAEKLD